MVSTIIPSSAAITKKYDNKDWSLFSKSTVPVAHTFISYIFNPSTYCIIKATSPATKISQIDMHAIIAIVISSAELI